jgi:hypothetical protein
MFQVPVRAMAGPQRGRREPGALPGGQLRTRGPRRRTAQGQSRQGRGPKIRPLNQKGE